MGNAVLHLTVTNKDQEMCRSGAAWAVLTMRWWMVFFSKKLDHNPYKEQTLASSGTCLEKSCGIQPWRKKGFRKAG